MVLEVVISRKMPRRKLSGMRSEASFPVLTVSIISVCLGDILPSFMGFAADEHTLSAQQLLELCPTFATAARYVKGRVLRRWLIPHVRSLLGNQDLNALEQHLLVRTVSVTVELMAQTSFYESIIEVSTGVDFHKHVLIKNISQVTLYAIEQSVTLDLLKAGIEILHRFLTIWTCLRNTGTITEALYAVHQKWRLRGTQRELLRSLVEFDRGNFLDGDARRTISQDITVMTQVRKAAYIFLDIGLTSQYHQALQPIAPDGGVVPAHLTDVLLLVGDDTPNAPAVLASNLWIKYRSHPDWTRKVWDNTVAALRQIPSIALYDVATQQAYATRYACFLWHIDQHLSSFEQ